LLTFCTTFKCPNQSHNYNHDITLSWYDFTPLGLRNTLMDDYLHLGKPCWSVTNHQVDADLV